uniref:Uncharacterized protein n=1 Tax=Haptolina ericina TaxID=156174 RepID=A0A7S3AIV7_9EUKA
MASSPLAMAAHVDMLSMPASRIGRAGSQQIPQNIGKSRHTVIYPAGEHGGNHQAEQQLRILARFRRFPVRSWEPPQYAKPPFCSKLAIMFDCPIMSNSGSLSAFSSRSRARCLSISRMRFAFSASARSRARASSARCAFWRS